MAIEHLGVIKEISADLVVVEIISESACFSCQAQAGCSLAESASKSLYIKCPTENFQVGEQVLVVMEQSLGYLAVLWCYVLPFVVVVSVLGITYYLTHHELFSGMLGLASLIPYYLFLLTLRQKFEKTFKLSVRKITL